MDPVRVYDLSFISKKESESGAPEIVVSVRRPFVHSFKELQFRFVPTCARGAKQYLGEDAPFAYFEPGHRNRRYGYRWCGRVEERNESVDLHFELYDFQARHTAATLHLTLHLLACLFPHHGERGSTSAEFQYVQLQTCLRNEVHGHSIEGWVFPAFGTWLATKEAGRKSAHASAAMKEAWEAVAGTQQLRFKGFVRVNESGAFLLSCPGDACDMGVYPDMLGNRHLGESMVRCASHNVESHTQQITLIVGLAALSDRARKDNEYRPPE